MKMKILSNYDNDKETRFGDCILLYDTSVLIVYDCGHEKHADEVGRFLKKNTTINEVNIVISHNDSDHTDGVIPLMEWLSQGPYSVTVYTSLYLCHLDAIEEQLDDGRRNKKTICEDIIEQFDSINEIINKANELGIFAQDALKDTEVHTASIVGPEEEEFVKVVAYAIENDGKGTIDGETVMNAASIQLTATLDNQKSIFLCGDASPEYMKDLNDYDVIQFPHHGQMDDAEAILDKLEDASYKKTFVISDNTGSTNGGSDELVQYLKNNKYTDYYNSKDGVIDLPKTVSSSGTKSSTKGVILGGMVR